MDQAKLKEIQKDPIVGVLDLETGSLANQAVVFCIGLTIGNVLTGEILGKFYIRVTQSSQENRVMDEDTMKNFWSDLSKVDKKAQREIYDAALARSTFPDALVKMNNYLRNKAKELEVKHIQLFGNGSEFDNAIVIDAMRQYGIVPAWRHWCNQSVRTLVWAGRLLLGIDPKYTLPFEGTEHHALDDATHTFKYMHEIIKAFQAKLVIDPPY